MISRLNNPRSDARAMTEDAPMAIRATRSKARKSTKIEDLTVKAKKNRNAKSKSRTHLSGLDGNDHLGA
jgi:hypothetical protein